MLVRFFCILIACFFSARSIAIEVKDLYEAAVEVKDKTRSTRVEASRQAFLQVLQKLTGRQHDLNHPLITSSKRSISDYMLKYEYIDTQDRRILYRVKFESGKVEQLVKDAGLPLWGNRRPKIAIWLVIEDDLRREFVTQDSYPQLERLIYDTAREWGVPVVVPLMDLQDRASVGIAEVWANFSDPIEQASKRYDAERVISGRIFKPENSESWQLEWRYTDTELFESTQLAGDKQQVLIEMVNQIASALASEYLIDPNESYATHSTVITIENLNSFIDIEKARRQIASISTVNDIDVVLRTKHAAHFEIEHASSVSDLQKALKLEKSFDVFIDPRAFHQVADEDNLTYIWVGQP